MSAETHESVVEMVSYTKNMSIGKTILLMLPGVGLVCALLGGLDHDGDITR